MCDFSSFGEFCDDENAPAEPEPQAPIAAPAPGVWVEPGDPAALGLDPRHPPEGWRHPKVLVLVPPPP